MHNNAKKLEYFEALLYYFIVAMSIGVNKEGTV